ncbi:hypothetical protein ID866_4161 [Astraeus odoratus]|nr:hypothetical protein ID866_4161 [Astraeus odoratus]
MSEQSIARWKAIPMNRQEAENEDDPMSSTKRSRSDRAESDEESEDNVSLVSRTPSPPPPGSMDVDKYDEYIHRTPAEVITVETKIKNTNKGFAMLAKLGWTEGQPLGLSADGRVDPIPFHIKNDLTGLGKINQDFRMIETTVAQRRVLDSERQRKETEVQRKAREDTVARRAAVKSEIIDTLRPFYCALCEKQFQNVAQYDEHTNSYAHHHKARLRDMQANARPVLQEDVEKRKEKERKREEKELRKLAKAAGIKMAKPSAVAGAVPALTPVAATDGGSTSEAKSGGFKKAGWAAISTGSDGGDAGFKRNGGAAVGSNTPSASRPPSPPPPPHRSPRVPSFQAGGWATLDTGSSRSFPPPPVPESPPPPPPPPSVPALPSLPPGEQPPPPPCALPSSALAKSSWVSVPPQRIGIPSPDPSSQSVSLASSSISVPAVHNTFPSRSAAPPRQEGKSGWQQWKQSKNFKRK